MSLDSGVVSCTASGSSGSGSSGSGSTGGGGSGRSSMPCGGETNPSVRSVLLCDVSLSRKLWRLPHWPEWLLPAAWCSDSAVRKVSELSPESAILSCNTVGTNPELVALPSALFRLPHGFNHRWIILLKNRFKIESRLLTSLFNDHLWINGMKPCGIGAELGRNGRGMDY